MCDTAGWYQDPFHTAPDSPCTVPTGWFHAAIGTSAIIWGLYTVSTVATLAILQRGGESWSSYRMFAYCNNMVFSVLFFACFLALWADPAGGLGDSGAAWRWLYLIGVFACCCVQPIAFAYGVLLGPAVRFVGGIDVKRFQQLDRAARLGVGATAFCYSVAVAGQGIALFGTTKDTQDSGVLVFLCGCIFAFIILTVTTQHMARLMQQLHASLNAASSSAKQVDGLRILLRRVALILGNNVPLYVIMATWGTLRALTGTVVSAGLALGFALPMSVFTPFFEYSRLKPARRARATRIVPVSPSTGGMPTRFGRRTISEFTAAATDEIVQARAQATQPGQVSQASQALSANGVSLRFMLDFADEHNVEDDTTAGEVCARHVKPMTAKAQVALVRVLQEGRDAVGARWCSKPGHFISYAWSYPFRLLIDIVERFEAENPAPPGKTHYYFLDQFSLNQHKFVDEGANQKQMQEMVVNALQSEMIRSAHVLMCLHPWNQPVPLRRMWCLFELFTAVSNDVELTMCFGEEDASALYTAIANGYFDAEDAVGEIDAANAGASVASDKDMIMRLIEEQVGLDRFNNEMREYLLKAFKATVTGVLARRHGGNAGSGAGGGRRGGRSGSRRSVDGVRGMRGMRDDASQRRMAGPAEASPAAPRALAAASGSTAGALVMTEAGAGAGSNASAALGEQMGQVCWRMSALEGQVGTRMSALEEQMGSQLGSQASVLGARMSALEEQMVSQLGSQASTLAARLSALEEQMASQVGARMSALEGQVSSQVGVVASRMTGLEEQIAALTRMLHSTRTHN